MRASGDAFLAVLFAALSAPLASQAPSSPIAVPSAGSPTVLARAAARGTVFEDRNANGIRDGGERGMPNIVVSNQDEVVRTDADGRYALGASGYGAVFVSVPRGYRAGGPWWKPATSASATDFALTAHREPVPLLLVHASDTHISPATIGRTQRLRALVDSIAPGVAIITGDLVRDALRVSESEAAGYYQLFNQEAAAFRTPLFTVPGNHEIFGVERARSLVSPAHPFYGRGMYRAFRGPDYYSFDAGGVHFVALNTVDVDDQWYHGHVDSLQLAWLRRDLAMVPDSVPVVTFNHIPMYSLGEQLGGYADGPPAPTLITVRGRTQFRHVVSNVAEVVAALGAHRWEIALGGHVHYRERLSLEVGTRSVRFHQSAATVSDSPAGPFLMPSGVTVYTVRNGVVDDGRFVPLRANP